MNNAIFLLQSIVEYALDENIHHSLELLPGQPVSGSLDVVVSLKVQDRIVGYICASDGAEAKCFFDYHMLYSMSCKFISRLTNYDIELCVVDDITKHRNLYYKGLNCYSLQL